MVDVDMPDPVGPAQSGATRGWVDHLKWEFRAGLKLFVRGWTVALFLSTVFFALFSLVGPQVDDAAPFSNRALGFVVGVVYGAVQGLLFGWALGLLLLTWRLLGWALIGTFFVVPSAVASFFYLFRFTLVDAGRQVGEAFVHSGVSLPAARIGDPIVALLLLPLLALHLFALPGLWWALLWLVFVFFLVVSGGILVGLGLCAPMLLFSLHRRLKARAQGFSDPSRL
jgi:hypothetical protein